MKCNECPENAGWILAWDEKYLLLCHGCLDSYIHIEGEINLDFWMIALGDWQTVFNHVNSKIKYWQEMYERAYSGEFQSSASKAKYHTHPDSMEDVNLKEAEDYILRSSKPKVIE